MAHWKPSLFDEDPYAEDDGDWGPRIVSCKRCGARNLVWEQEADERWILISATTHEIHYCQPKNVIDDFDALP